MRDQFFSSSFSVQENEFKSNLIAITGDNPGDRTSSERKEKMYRIAEQ